MATENKGNEERVNEDRVLAGVVHWNLSMGRSHVSEILWRCDTVRAGKLYNRSVFGTREEAETFAETMRAAEPDQMFNVEAIKASTVWN